MIRKTNVFNQNPRLLFSLTILLLLGLAINVEASVNEDTLNKVLTHIISETKEERLTRLHKEYPIEWFYKKYGKYSGEHGKYNSCEDPHFAVPEHCHINIYAESFTDEQIKQIIINGMNFTNQTFDLRVFKLSFHKFIRDISKNPNNYSKEIQKFIYHPDVLFGMIIYPGDTDSNRKDFHEFYNLKK